ncbi:MAG: acyl-CoA dehydrogenase, partial [Actinomycetota bacterium]
MSAPDLTAASAAVDLARGVVSDAARHLAAAGAPDDHQVALYDLAHATSAVDVSRFLLDYGTKGETEAAIACAFIADAVHGLA